MKCLIIENIRSAYNVGAIFRTADGAGVSKIFLIGYTPTPLDRFNRIQPEIAKTSLGANESIAWEYHKEIEPTIKNLKKEGFQIVAVEQTPESISLKNFHPNERVIYIVGNEIDGVSDIALKLADKVVELPMLGTKESLNVSVTAGIVLYHDLFQ